MERMGVRPNHAVNSAAAPAALGALVSPVPLVR